MISDSRRLMMGDKMDIELLKRLCKEINTPGYSAKLLIVAKHLSEIAMEFNEVDKEVNRLMNKHRP